MVVANILDRRKEEVQLVQPASGSSTSTDVMHIHRHADEPFIEKQLVDAVVAQHTAFCQQC